MPDFRYASYQAVEDVCGEVVWIVFPCDEDWTGVPVRESDERFGPLFSYVDLQARVRGDHPSRVIRGIANAALAEIDADPFNCLGPTAMPRPMAVANFVSYRAAKPN